MSILLTLIMIATGVGALVGMKKLKAGDESGRPLAIGCAVITLVLAGVRILSEGDSSRARMLETVEHYNQASGATLGQHLCEAFPGARMLILVRPSMGEDELSTVESALLEGLTAALQSGGASVDRKEIRPPPEFLAQFEDMEGEEGEQEMIMFEEMYYDAWFTVESLMAILSEETGVHDVVISTLGLPMDMDRVPPGPADDLPALAILNGSAYNTGGLIRSGLIDAMVVHKPVASAADIKDMPRDTAKAFAQRYLLVTPENFDAVVAEYPQLFGS